MEAVNAVPITLTPAVQAVTGPPSPRVPRRTLAALALLGGWMAVLIGLHGAGTNAAPLLRDPATMAGLPVWHGMLSTLGCMAWALVAALCLALWVAGGSAARTWGLLALLAAALGVDDALMLHEEVLPSAGVQQELTFLAYGALAATIASDIRRHPALFDLPLLLVGCTALAGSVAVDVLAEGGAVILEDGPKVFGIATLAVWALGRVRAQLGAGPDVAGA